MRPQPKKRLGQNFLIDSNIKRKIISACAFSPEDIVLEIGAGRGELTGLIASGVKQVIAVEIDPDLCALLKEKYADNAKIKIIGKDILRLDLKKRFLGARLKVVGNIPYYISSPIIAHLLRYKQVLKVIFLTVQKEFGRRLSASWGGKDYGAFSCFVQYHAVPKILFTVKKSCFFPQPKVDSVFLRLAVRGEPAVSVKNERLFFKVIRSAFGQRRKTCRNSLKGVVPLVALDTFFARYKISPAIRPEGLRLEDFAHLANLWCQLLLTH